MFVQYLFHHIHHISLLNQSEQVKYMMIAL